MDTRLVRIIKGSRDITIIRDISDIRGIEIRKP
jgi:hypothetical protein